MKRFDRRELDILRTALEKSLAEPFPWRVRTPDGPVRVERWEALMLFQKLLRATKETGHACADEAEAR